MKHLKRYLAAVLALFMAFAIATPAYASDYKITVTNTNDTVTINGKEYTAYKLFDVTYTASGATDPHSYTIDSDGAGAWAWSTIRGTAGTGGVYTNSTYGLTFTPSASDPTVYVVTSTMTGTQARNLADALEGVLPSTGGKSATASGETAVIDVEGPGYWLVYGKAAPKDPSQSPIEEVVAACALTTADPTETINPKVGIPTLDKKITGVSEGTAVVNGAVLDKDGQAAVAKVGSTVAYQVDSVTPDVRGYDDYTFIISDALSNGLTYNQSSFELKIDGTKLTSGYTLAFASGDDPKSFTLTIPYSTLKNYTAEKAIVLTYTCVVNDDALTYDYENNTASLEYSSNPYKDDTNHTPEKKTYVIDLNLDVLKVDKDDTSKTLDGATFKLYREVTDGTTTTIEYYKWDATNKKVTWTTTKSEGDDFVTNANGKLTQQVRGLDKGTYFLLETVAPKGYNLLASPVQVVITVNEANGTVTYSAKYDGQAATMTNGSIDLDEAHTADLQPVATGTIANDHGVELPSTGGIGTTLFYVIGSAMIITAGVVLVTKRRMAQIEE